MMDPSKPPSDPHAPSPESDAPSGVSTQWATKVAAYADELEKLAERIDLILDDTRVGTVSVEQEQVEQSANKLLGALQELESMVGRREELLRCPEAPKEGVTLRSKLLSTRRIEDARLERRCHEVAENVKTTHERALSLFVCQYHLSALTQDLVHLMTGTQPPGTYQKPSESKPPAQGGGGLFDEAA